jgi:hypothetical protein
MKPFLLALLTFVFGMCTNLSLNQTCKGCHTTIYNEFTQSMHKKSSPFEDEIYKQSLQAYHHNDKDCRSCHTPLAKKDEVLNRNSVAVQEGISCAYCHRIKEIDAHNNLLNEQNKHFYSKDKNKKQDTLKYQDKTSLLGMIKEKKGSPYHTIDYSNDDFYTANMCMGCHKSVKNHQGMLLFNIKEQSTKDTETNCITCHMPQVKGSISSIKKTNTHAYHGFGGVHHKSGLMKKYIKLSLKKGPNGFLVGLKNEASHELFLHPLRQGVLKVEVVRNKKAYPLPPKVFEKNFNHSNHWKATEITSNTVPKANEKQAFTYDFVLKHKDRVLVTLGYYLVKPSQLSALKLNSTHRTSKFMVLKQQHFMIEQ